MKKSTLAFLIGLVLVLLILCFYAYVADFTFLTEEPTVSSPVEATTEATAPIESEEPEPTPDPRDDEQIIRSEIDKMIQDADALIQEGLYDDAAMVIRDLRTRSLTQAEKEKVDALQNMISLSE